MANQLNGNFATQLSNASGLLVGGSITFYQAGSTTIKQAIYADAGETTELSNPQTLGSLGQLENVIFLNGNYNIVVRDANGITLPLGRDNFDASSTTRTVADWMSEAQDAGGVMGTWTEVKAEGTITLAAGDVVMGDTGNAFYKLTGDSNQNPESDTYNVNTGIGSDWIKLDISNAPITQSSIDSLQTQIDAIEASFDTEGYINGLELSNGTDADHDINSAAGTAQDSTGEYRMTSSGVFTKAIDANWAVGTNQGGFPDNLTLTGNTWYRYYMVGKTSSVTDVDFGFDTSATAANLLNGTNAGASGFTIYRQIGWVYTDASLNILPFIYNNGYYQWTSPTTDQTITGTSSLPSSRTNYGVIVPPSLLGDFNINISVKPTGSLVDYCYGMVTSPDGADITPTETLSNLLVKTAFQNDGGYRSETANYKIAVNSSSEIGLKFAYTVTVDTKLNIVTNGFYYTP